MYRWGFRVGVRPAADLFIPLLGPSSSLGSCNGDPRVHLRIIERACRTFLRSYTYTMTILSMTLGGFPNGNCT